MWLLILIFLTPLVGVDVSGKIVVYHPSPKTVGYYVEYKDCYEGLQRIVDGMGTDDPNFILYQNFDVVCKFIEGAVKPKQSFTTTKDGL